MLAIASLRTLLQVHRKHDSGSPRVVDSNIFSRSTQRRILLLGALAHAPGTPNPATRVDGGCSSSFKPWRITGRETPVAIDGSCHLRSSGIICSGRIISQRCSECIFLNQQRVTSLFYREFRRPNDLRCTLRPADQGSRNPLNFKSAQILFSPAPRRQERSPICRLKSRGSPS